MSKPIIGITALDDQEHADYSGSDVPHAPRYGQNQTYIRAVEAAGGVPIIIPILHDEIALRCVYALLDGLLLPGGWDVDPAYYGEAPHPSTVMMPDLDVIEFKLVEWAIADQMPILAICRGMQVLNVALGGDLYQDIASQMPAAANHNQREEQIPAQQGSHEIIIAPHSYLATISDASNLAVNTFHHQAVRRVAEPLRVSAVSTDGLIEAVEWSTNDRFVHALQCHPEYLWDDHSWAGRLFRDFVAACEGLTTNDQSPALRPLR